MSKWRLAPPASVAVAACSFAAIGTWWAAGGGSGSISWVPSWGLRLAFTLDGLGALYALLATGVGLLVTIYSTAYIPAHLEHEGRPHADQTRFYGFLLLFIAAMVGLALAADLLLLAICFDLTAVASYFLIGFDRHQAEARRAALTALVVTGATSIGLLAGVVLLGVDQGTFSIPRLVAAQPAGTTASAAAALIVLAAVAKSAQVPLHFWLPRAMVAPTPVSAYLHSAAMVAAGVFLLTRLYPLLTAIAGMREVMLAVGIASMLVGGLLALTRDLLKQVLAYSTVAQYGYVMTLLGLGGAHALPAASFYVLAHGLIKSALFLTAGVVMRATGQERLSHLGGLGGRMRLLAGASGTAAAGLAGIPLTLGFFKDELLFTTALDRGPVWAGIVVVAAALTLAYAWRFWSGIFLGSPPDHARRSDGAFRAPSLRLTLPVVALALVVLGGGLVVAPFARLATAAGASVAADAATLHPGYHLELRPQYLMALLAWTLGALLIGSRRQSEPLARRLSRLGEMAGPERAYAQAGEWLTRLSRFVATGEPHDLRGRVLSILLPGGTLVVLAAIAAWDARSFRSGGLSMPDAPLAIALLLTAAFAIATALTRSPLTVMLGTALVSSALVAVFALRGAPDVALVAMAVGTVLTLLLIVGLALFPAGLLRGAARRSPAWPRRELLVAAVTAASGFAIVWDALSRPLGGRVAARHIALTPQAHGRDVVTTILADFRGLDTLGESTVIVIVLLGIVTLARGVERRR